MKVVSAILGHSTSSFTMDVYAVVAQELAEAAAVAIAAYVPRKARRRQQDPPRASFVPAGARYAQFRGHRQRHGDV
jgi:hypothetical protein